MMFGPEDTPIEQAARGLTAKGWCVDWKVQPIPGMRDGFVMFRRKGAPQGVYMLLTFEEDAEIRAGRASIRDRVAEAIKLAGPLRCAFGVMASVLLLTHFLAASLT